MYKVFFIAILATQLIACSAEVGSEAWCADIKGKDKADWSASEAADYTKHCIFK